MSEIAEAYGYDDVSGRLTRAWVLWALVGHHVYTTLIFDEDVKPGPDGLYDADDVLGWLGYPPCPCCYSGPGPGDDGGR